MAKYPFSVPKAIKTIKKRKKSMEKPLMEQISKKKKPAKKKTA